MADDIARRDPNYIPVIQGVSSADGKTVTDIWVNPITNRTIVDSRITATDIDFMLGTDFSNVFGTASLISATPAVKTEEQPSTGVNGGPVTVGTSEVELTFTGTTRFIMIQSDPDNTGRIWGGLTGVTNVGANAFFQLEPGDAVTMGLNDASAAMFAISDTAAQNVFKMTLT